MAVPRISQIWTPVLENMSDREEVSLQTIRQKISKTLNLSDDDLHELMPSGESRFYYNVRWACTYLKKSLLVKSTKRGMYQITDRGLKALADKPENESLDLMQFKEYRLFRQGNKTEEEQVSSNDKLEKFLLENPDITPQQLVNIAKKMYESGLKGELLQRLHDNIEPIDLENIVLKLMESMNYGIGRPTKRSWDGGIDGVIDEDELGLDRICLQVKKYAINKKVHELEMRNFAGALSTSSVNKGIFVTTSDFDKKASESARNAHAKGINIKLINGSDLVELLIKHNLGIKNKETIEIKQVDIDFFSHDEEI